MPEEPTEVMSLDELMSLAAERRPDTATATTATVAMPTALPTTPPAPGPLNPATPRPQPAPAPKPVTREPAGPDLRQRVRADARQAYEAALERSGQWLRQGDNGLIVATAIAALLLVLVVATL